MNRIEPTSLLATLLGSKEPTAKTLLHKKAKEILAELGELTEETRTWATRQVRQLTGKTLEPQASSLSDEIEQQVLQVKRILFNNELDNWVNEKPGETNRILAAQKILFAYNYKHTRLSLSGMSLTSLPACIGNLTKLTELDIRANKLSTLPESIGNLTQLTKLYIRANLLTTLPESIGNLTQLTVLDIKGNLLSTLPESIGNLTQLTVLDIGNNLLSTLPEFIGNLTKLTQLWIQGNQLSTLPEFIGNLTQLSMLDISNNNYLSHLPLSLINCTGITDIFTRNTEISDEERRRFASALRAARGLAVNELFPKLVASWKGFAGVEEDLSVLTREPVIAVEKLCKLLNCKEVDLNKVKAESREGSILVDVDGVLHRLSIAEIVINYSEGIKLPEHFNKQLYLRSVLIKPGENLVKERYFTPKEQGEISEWLLRLTKTADFRYAKAELSKKVCLILTSVRDNIPFGQLFIQIIAANNKAW